MDRRRDADDRDRIEQDFIFCESLVGALNRTGRLLGSGGGVPNHATCTTQDIGSLVVFKV